MPNTASLSGGQTQQFNATVGNTTNTAVTWSIAPAAAGSITATGLYTAPASINAQQTVTVTVTSQADTTKSASAIVTLTPPNDTLTLSPTVAGPDVAGTTQTMIALVLGPASAPVVGASVQFSITGANAMSGAATTDATGKASFTYTGTKPGTDAVQASLAGALSNTAKVSWVTPIEIVSSSTLTGKFFVSDGSGAFDTPITATPAFTEVFPVINFNPPAGTVPGNTSGVNVNSRPFVDVTTDLNGNFTGTIVAEGNGYQAGVGPMYTFQAVFSGQFTVASAGNVVFQFFTDDGFIFGVGGGATRVSGTYSNPPPNNLTPFYSLPVIGSYNQPSAPTGNSVVINFPAPGSYPFEVDYSECCGGQLSLTMASGATNPTGIPPTGSLTLSPNGAIAAQTGTQQTFTVLVADASGTPVPNQGVALMINGVNLSSVSGATDNTGHVSLSYSGLNSGSDSIQAVATIDGLDAFSNIATVTWTLPAGQPPPTEVTPPTQYGATAGVIGSPLTGSTVTGIVPITIAAGTTLTSGTLSYSPASNNTVVTVLNANVTGSGQIATLDTTLLQNGSYWIQLDATDSNGNFMTSLALITVAGNNKPGRLVTSTTDLSVPLPGLPISIQRGYDTLQSNNSGDFGYGWSLGTKVESRGQPELQRHFDYRWAAAHFLFHSTDVLSLLLPGNPRLYRRAGIFRNAHHYGRQLRRPDGS